MQIPVCKPPRENDSSTNTTDQHKFQQHAMVMVIMIMQEKGLPNNHACIVSDVTSSLKQLLLGRFLHHFLKSDFVLYLTQGDSFFSYQVQQSNTAKVDFSRYCISTASPKLTSHFFRVQGNSSCLLKLCRLVHNSNSFLHSCAR